MATSTDEPAIVERDRLLEVLRVGELRLEGRLVEATNATFLGTARLAPTGVVDAALEVRCIYKPIAGERPLWDFPDGTLAHREVAAFLVSEAAGWAVVPATVFRDEGPYGAGMAQEWIAVDEAYDLVAALRKGTPALRRIALFDVVVNNTDRKGGHLLATADGRLLGVDHGVCFSVEPKLRTILWGWRGTRLRAAELATLEALRSDLDGTLGVELARHLHDGEIVATRERVAGLLATRRFPQPNPDWPAVPWPPF
ncbi:MAG: SCO1664 family protein [Candidatus Limnocylindrales bacterium]